MGVYPMSKPEHYRYNCIMPTRGIEIFLLNPDEIEPSFKILVYAKDCKMFVREKELYTLDISKATDAFIEAVKEFKP